jgi:cytochrome c peroxidase
MGYQGLETQAIAALSVHRMQYLEQSPVTTNAAYQALWTEAFPNGEPVSLETVGLAIAAYERTLLSSRAPFQRWLRGESGAMTPAQKRGALVFFGVKADCEQCHTGPALNSVNFYALGMSDLAGPDVLGPVPPSTGRGGFLQDGQEEFKFKIPQLYNLADSPFLGHGGTFVGLRAVVDYYNDARPDVALPAGRLAKELVPLELTEDEVADLTEFLSVALRDPDLARFAPEALPSGNCFPAADAQARVDLGC